MTAALTLAAPLNIQTPDDSSISIYEAWLAVDAEHEQLIRAWQKLENQLVQRANWYKLSQQQRNSMPQAAQLESIETQLDALFSKRTELLHQVPLNASSSARGIELKLAIALACLPEDENKEAHTIIKSALSDLRVMSEVTSGRQAADK